MFKEFIKRQLVIIFKWWIAGLLVWAVVLFYFFI
ncbi:hypothetical protein MOMOMM089B2_14745 [Morganella morganii]